MIIYLITNRENGKCYVGKTALSAQRRWKAHCSKAKGSANTRLHRAIRKYGTDAFVIQEICVAVNALHLDFLERYFIGEFNSMNRECGYNMTPGGDGVAPGTKLTKEHRAKLSAARKGKPNIGHFKKGQIPHTKGKSPSLETRKKISVRVSESLIGNTRRKGKPHSEEIKQQIAASVRKSGNGDPLLMGERARKFWAEISPESREEYLLRREAARQATLLIKKLLKETAL